MERPHLTIFALASLAAPVSADGTYDLQWFNPDSNEWEDQETIIEDAPAGTISRVES